MWRTVELANIHNVVLVFEHGCFIVVHVEVIGRTEYGDERGEACCLAFAVHPVTGILGLMGADDRQQVVMRKEITACRVRVEIRAAANAIVAKMFSGTLLRAKVLKGI